MSLCWQPVVWHRQPDVVVVSRCLNVVGPADGQHVVLHRRGLRKVVVADDTPVPVGGVDTLPSAANAVVQLKYDIISLVTHNLETNNLETHNLDYAQHADTQPGDTTN